MPKIEVTPTDEVVYQGSQLDPVPVPGSEFGSVLVAGRELPNAELSRAGRRFHGGLQTLANGIAPVTAIPTTAAGLSLYNPETGKAARTYFLDHLAWFLASGTPALGLTLLLCVAKVTTVPTAMTAGWNVGSASGSVRGSRALWATGLTLTTAGVWAAYQSFNLPAAAGAGIGADAPPLQRGGVAIPPQSVLAVAFLSSGAGTTPLFGISASWVELENTPK